MREQEDPIKEWHVAHNRLREMGNRYFPLMQKRSAAAARELAAAQADLKAAKAALDEAFERVIELSEKASLEDCA